MGKSEEWKQIKDFPNYYISNKGRVASNGMKPELMYLVGNK